MEWITAFDGVFVRVGLYLLLFWPTVGYYVREDSKRRGLSAPAIRGITYGFLGILGLLRYISRKALSGSQSS